MLDQYIIIIAIPDMNQSQMTMFDVEYGFGRTIYFYLKPFHLISSVIGIAKMDWLVPLFKFNGFSPISQCKGRRS